ncbi:exopolysaccharide biosynthesis polyprenyl glycosylphosphotransferase [Aquiflexum gelatinilyticum]|uniref:exopolysaccharide biosynthesis polyprenyl glycosylphosphotransferase n=1 Tax=Aquiflexum gelatinilyticum TaxID=2961943 RepID=UPI002166CD31|nr:exopolysaccharide biosynthesis polyprenyl glycosylphosphotransferase [Aquiflexum gelatinilyticum]MCS4434340.1 exopolysaccharide biosynthesis polyprenyl glycosylphosphotransferase [Aquiflexum gelatinilyticum]
MTNHQKSNVPILVFWDVISLTIAFFISLYFYRINDLNFQKMEIVFLLGLISLWLIIGYSNKLYVEWTGSSFVKSRMSKYFKTYFILAGIIGILYLVFSFPKDVRNLLIAILAGIPSLGIITNSLVIRLAAPIKERRTKMSTTLIAGSGQLANKVAGFLESSSYARFAVQGFIDCNPEVNGKSKHERTVATLDSLKEYLKFNFADEIIIALPYNEMDKIKSIVEIADYHGTRIRFVPDYQGIFGENFKTYQFGDLQLVNIRQLPLDNWFPNLLKNIFDIVFASTVLLFLSPIFVVIGILIKMDSPGPVFYTPIRIGKGGKQFKVFKFRSMKTNDSVVGGTQSTVKDDPRITKIGKFLRKYSLDELPQFINVLTGEMSVVGPRPHRIFLNQVMQETEDKYMVRHYYKPGITGWAQVNGWRGPMETEEQKKQRTSHDLEYLKKWTLLFDIKIIWLTVFGKKTHEEAF